MDALHRTTHGNLCGGCFADIPGLKETADVLAAEGRVRLAQSERDGMALLLESQRVVVEQLLDRVAMLEAALAGAQAERTIMQKEVDRCRSTSTVVEPAATLSK